MDHVARYVPGAGFVETGEVDIHVSDPVLVSGFGVYETLKRRGGVLYFPERHLARLGSSARIIGISFPYDSRVLARDLVSFSGHAGGEDLNVRLLYFGTRGERASELLAFPTRPPVIDKKLYHSGCRVISFAGERSFPAAKTLGTVLGTVAFTRARAAGAYEALFVNHVGEITEGTRSNAGFLKGRRLYTAPDDVVLAGVTRETVLETARAIGMEVVKEAVSLADVGAYDAAFVCSTSAAVIPVAHIDGVSFNRSKRTVLDELCAAYREFLRDYAAAKPKGAT